MQFRFRQVIEYGDNIEYKLKSIIDITDYTEMYKMLTFQKEINQVDGIVLNTEDIADRDGECYTIKDVFMVIPKISGEVLPYIQVDIE